MAIYTSVSDLFGIDLMLQIIFLKTKFYGFLRIQQLQQGMPVYKDCVL